MGWGLCHIHAKHRVNTDGSSSAPEGWGGGGVVVARDHRGSFIARACHFFPAAVDPEW
jgi:hypothetical protein